MADITEPVKVFLETSQNFANDDGQPTAIDVLFFDDNPVLPNTISHLNRNSLSTDKAVNILPLTDISHLNSDLLCSNQTVNIPLLSDTNHLNSDEAVITPVSSETSHLNSDEAVNTPLLSDTSHLNSDEAVNTPVSSETFHLNSDEAVNTPVSSETSHLNSNKPVNTPLSSETSHLNSDEAVKTPLSSETSHLNSDEAINTPLPSDSCHLNSDEAVNTSVSSETFHFNGDEAIYTPLPSDLCHLINNKAVNTSLLSDTTHLNSDEAVNTPVPSEISHLNSDETVNTSLSSETYHLNSEDVVNTVNTPSLQDSVSDMSVDVFDPLLDKPANSSTKQFEDYKIGDIVWAKIGKYPYWPSIVCVDPTLNIHYKEKKRFLLHVRFCNDKGRRSWATTTENYYGKHELLSKYPGCLSYFKNSKKLLETWELAVQEADNLMKLDRELRMVEFFKSFCNPDSVTPSILNKSSEGTVSTLKVRTYSRKRSLTVPEQDRDSKIMKTENMAVHFSSSRLIDIPLQSRSDDADSTVSDFSMSYAFMEDIGLKAKQETVKKRRSTKTYPPKSSVANKYDLCYSMVNSPENNDSNSVSDTQDKCPVTTTKSSTRSVPDHRKLEISILEGEYDQDNIIFPNTRRSKKKNTRSNTEINLNNGGHSIHLQSSSSSKKTVTKKKVTEKENSSRRKSNTVKYESSPEPDTTESEASSKNETYSSVFLTSSKNKQLFTKTWKRACVVCKNIKDTVKCLGPCQSYFHRECLNKSEERYNQTKVKKTGRRKRQYSKITQKNEDSAADNPQLINNIKEEDDTDNFFVKDDEIKSNGLRSLSPTQCSSYTNEETKSLNQFESDKLFKNETCLLTANENTQSELESINEDSIREISEEKNVTPIVPIKIDEKLPLDNLKYMCSLCKANKTNCFVCGLVIDDSGQKIVCKISSCGKYFHENCLKDWPQCQWIQGSRNNVRCVICPHHVCHLCISDDPKSSCKTHFPAEKITRCIKCPTAYHRSEYCLPAGCQVLTYNDIICSRHFEPIKVQIYHYNATWCFICALSGGSLVFCDLCPSSFHINCLNQDPSAFEGGFTCEECQTGRYPLYGEIVWVKIGNFRWWPAQIIFPNEVPDSVNAIPHTVGQFAVRFFGTYDYYWVNRGRVFNFHEGDDENVLRKNNMKVIDKVFQDSIFEAAQAHSAYILEKEKNDAIVAKSFTKPPKFTRIKFNKPIGNVKNMEFDITAMTPCECDPTKPNPCGPGSDCINRMLMFECEPKVCPAGDKCNNQRFEKTLYPAMVPFLTKGRGWGLKTLEDIKEGSFVIEYVGDVIDEEEFQRRCLEMHQRNEQNYYFLTIDNSRTIDAGPKGNLSRFMNHSCEPNCVTQKWTVNGDTRIGLFALHDIPTGTELVFDYRLQSCSGVEKKPCQCGAARCSKFIGVKVEEEKKKVISSNDVDKCKGSSKYKRKPLKLKDNVSDSDKSKSSKVTSNDQNISTIEVKVKASNAEKIVLSKKSRSKTSIGKSSTALKNGNSESSETPAVVKRKWKNSAKNVTNMTKNDISVDDSLESEKNVSSKGKLRNGLSIFSSRKLLIKDDTSDTDDYVIVKKERQYNSYKKKNLMKRELLSLPSPILNELSSAKILNSSEGKGNDIKPEKSTRPQENSRNNLTRLAKSRHLFLSKNDLGKEKKVQPIVSNIKFNKRKKKLSKTTKIVKNSDEMLSRKTILMKKTKINKDFLQSKAYFKNDSCVICGKGHTELSCKNKKCPRVFHLSCINKTRIVKSGFICPSHFCSLCNKRKVVAKCKFCVESYCAMHVKGNIFKDPLGNGMLCTTHHPNKKTLPIVSNPVIPDLNAGSKVNIVNNNAEPIDFVDPSFNISISEELEDDDDSLNINIDRMNEEEYTQSQVVKDECNREYIHIGGFNVCNMSDLVSDQGKNYTIPVDTDGDLFKPSLANVVIDIESASAFYQPMDNLQLVSIATDKESHDCANVNFITDTNQSKNKWLAAEP
ncbi:PREDICTED: histone-lysine N-methyltransferase, H3 lysine-36 and H4 lysine-20 specific-like [Diuraphis noxia]|uniref:histone-lysine N-methyltransferase, H3 lysine-36 and H4 lysine-20 specific-like n=1 Tax=Diuraphis noxia TaxID=143948 RepID=UPI000763A2A5|nr:PREDICTED: histone-lysine N-methyltransferase, H3 lysine-36 and H4 lysine-20 specific-like [Diuraphis noxia]XP_015369933.1 PREDICTED: histone-lysine N-methyltransferase, H3 lysine-36 and H4 lysine-20 specific-like [Diuraphis noxia]XP_015369934.1 PREDICTED: histone-lysine N-methyltransferase, H3 lysine-36 and H4 lysine-20 specific-like [Diuraphis noxia]